MKKNTLKHFQVIESISQKLKEDDKNVALFNYGSVARKEHNEKSDIDFIHILQSSEFRRYRFKTDTVDGIKIQVFLFSVNSITYHVLFKKNSPFIKALATSSIVFCKNNYLLFLKTICEKLYNESLYIPSKTDIIYSREYYTIGYQKCKLLYKNNDILATSHFCNNLLCSIIRFYMRFTKEYKVKRTKQLDYLKYFDNYFYNYIILFLKEKIPKPKFSSPILLLKLRYFEILSLEFKLFILLKRQL